MKNILLSLCKLFFVLLLMGGCSHKYVFSENQTYRVSDEQLRALSRTENVRLEDLKEMQLKTNKNDINIRYDNVESVLRRTPPPPPPCQCKPKQLILTVDPTRNQVIVKSREDNLLVSYDIGQANPSLVETISALPNKELILENR
jgi:hypothetical protein